MGGPMTLCGSFSQHAVMLGAAMHNAGYAALGLPFSYVPFEVQNIERAVAAMRALSLRGVGVSVPFKRAVMPLLDALDSDAESIGAVNTIVNDGGRLTGHNTDWQGGVRALREVSPLRDKRVLLIGAGGAARALATGLQRQGARLTICNRTDASAQRLAAKIGAAVLPFEQRAGAAAFEVVVNASSAGMAGHSLASPLPAVALQRGQLVMDAVYQPLRTKLLSLAAAAGARVIDGSRMLLHQAAAQFELYTNQAAPLQAMDDALRAHIAAANL